MTTVPPSPQYESPSSDLPPLKDPEQRRFIIITVLHGEDVEVDWEGTFAWWELTGAIKRALDLVEEEQFADEANGDTDEEE